MKLNKKFWELLTLLVLFGLLTTEIGGNSKLAITNTQISILDVKESIVFNDFGNFTQVLEDENIFSQNGMDYIYFHNDGLFTGNVSEAYALNFALLGNCSYFNVALTLNYTNFEIEDIVEFYLVAGSFYDFDGQFIVENHTDESMITFAGIKDDRIDSRGRFVIGTQWSDTLGLHESAPEAIGWFSYITIQIERNESGLYREIKYFTNDTIALEYYNPISMDLNRSLNYVSLLYKSATTPSDNIHVLCYDFFGNFTFDSISPIINPTNNTTPSFSFPFPGFNIIITFTATTFVAIICLIITRKK